MHSGVFLTNFEAFENVVKHCFDSLIYIFDRHQNLGENGEIIS